MKKSISCILLVLVMLLSLLAGCGESGQNTTPESASAGTNELAENTAAPAVPGSDTEASTVAEPAEPKIGRAHV